MKFILGIDVGISTTKIVGLNEQKKILSPLRITATDPVTSLYGAFGKFLHDNEIAISDVQQVMLTGVGSAYIQENVYDCPTRRVEEFLADGLGAQYDTNLERMLVVSMGTGTSIVQCDENGICRIGGLGLGGGMLAGMSRIMLKTDDIKQVASLAMQGDLKNIDVQIGDISPSALPGLPQNATASLFANAKSNATREDIALGLITTTLQTIGSATILSAIGLDIKDFVLIGNLTRLPQCKDVFPGLEKLFGVKFIIPKHSEFSTAIGAALAYFK